MILLKILLKSTIFRQISYLSTSFLQR